MTPTPTATPLPMAVASLDPTQWTYVAFAVMVVIFAVGVLLAVKL